MNKQWKRLILLVKKLKNKEIKKVNIFNLVSKCLILIIRNYKQVMKILNI